MRRPRIGFSSFGDVRFTSLDQESGPNNERPFTMMKMNDFDGDRCRTEQSCASVSLTQSIPCSNQPKLKEKQAEIATARGDILVCLRIILDRKSVV